jgi:hypothetical protein
MGEQSLADRLRLKLGSIGWRIFIYCHWNGDECAYFRAIKDDFDRNL